MENEYMRILNSVLQYEKSQFIIVSTGLMAVLAILMFVAVKQFKKKTVFNKIIILAIAVTLCAAFAGYLIQYNTYRTNIHRDIACNATVTYHGEFTHDDYQKDSFYHNVYIIDSTGEDLLLRYPDYANIHSTYSDFCEMPLGTFSGTIVYGKNSRIVLKWTVDTGSAGDQP
jgi:hypothetical protein